MKASEDYKKTAAIGNGDKTYKPSDNIAHINAACIDAKLARTIFVSGKRQLADPKISSDYAELAWVDYILTTANNWETPIKDFELDIQKPSTSWYLSLC